MGDEKKKPSGGSKGGGTFKKVLILVLLVLVGAELASRLTSQATWSPMYWVQTLLLKK